MEKLKINYLGIIGCVILYTFSSFASAFIGFLSPWCWIVMFPALAAILGVPSYLWAASRWQRFGVATLFAAALALLLISFGEISLLQTFLMIVVGVVSDIVRQMIGNGIKQGVLVAYPVLSLCVFIWLMKLWTDSEWYYQGAVEEMGDDYANVLLMLSSMKALLLICLFVLLIAYATMRLLVAKTRLSSKLG